MQAEHDWLSTIGESTYCSSTLRGWANQVNDFLNEEECAALIAKASTGMKKQVCSHTVAANGTDRLCV